MDKQLFNQAYLQVAEREVSLMVERQVSRLLSSGYSYRDIFRAIWHMIEIKGLEKESLDIFGIGLLVSDPRGMDESVRYFKNLEITRNAAKKSAIEAKKKNVETITVKRQKRKKIREEFKWDE